MNKTVTINLSGIIFHIDEDAYQKLSSYLTTIKGYFSESEGRDEIMSDIENRIAEMLSEKISDRKQVVLMTDVEYVISVMGKPEDFAGDKSKTEESKKEQPIYSSSGRRRRVFRDTDNKILGGVCSGIGTYFNIDPLWLRLALVVCFFSFGIGFLLYIILWIVIPEAKTSAEKLEMHGEDINVSNIGKKVEEEMKQFGKKMGDWGEEVKKTASASASGGRDFINRFVDFLSSVFGAFFKILAKLLGVFFVIIGLLLLAGIISSLFGGVAMIHLYQHSFSLHDIFHTFFESGGQVTLASIAIVLCLGVPLIMLVYGGVKMLLGIRAGNRIVTVSAGILWVLGLALACMLGMQVAEQFSDESTTKEEFEMKKTKCDTLFLRVKEVKDWDDENKFRRKHFHVGKMHNRIFYRDSSDIYFGYPTLDIVKSESDSMEIVVYNDAMGKDKKEALHYARNIRYEIYQMDSLLELMPYFSIPWEEKWRNQQVHVEVRLPKGKTVYLAKNMGAILDDVHNETDTYDGDMAGRRWIMGQEELKCLDCNGLETKHKKKWKKHLHDSNIQMDTNDTNNDE